MYYEYFGLKEAPFSIAPDPRYLYLSTAHREALAHLLFGLRGDGGFVLLTGEVGTGKTTVCRCLLDLVPNHVQVALILNPKLTVEELLATICDELGIFYPAGNTSHKVFIDGLNRFLLEAHSRGRTTVLIIDEAQNLTGEVLEQLRLLTNLETNRHKLLQIILIGQPELRDLLDRPELRQVAQRITARYHLGPLNRQELAGYLQHRLAVAGVRRSKLFTPTASILLHRYSRGIPRMINVLCDRALLGAYARGRAAVNARIIMGAAREVLAPSWRTSSLVRWRPLFLLAIAVTLAAVGHTQIARTIELLIPNTSQATAPTVTREGVPEPPPGPVAPNLADLKSSPPPVPTWTPDLLVGKGNRAGAESALLRLWGLDPGAGVDLCQVARQDGLECLEGVGTLQTLAVLDHPALLKLFTDRGEPFFATMVGIQGDEVVLAGNDEIGLVGKPELEPYWLGNFVLLWRPAFPFAGPLKPGSRGPEVAWLSRNLPWAEGTDPSAVASDRFGPGLATRGKRFQLHHGLVPDGIAGSQTLIILNHEIGIAGPRLNETSKEY
jgi:general secretion pathway protein A